MVVLALEMHFPTGWNMLQLYGCAAACMNHYILSVMVADVLDPVHLAKPVQQLPASHSYNRCHYNEPLSNRSCKRTPLEVMQPRRKVGGVLRNYPNLTLYFGTKSKDDGRKLVKLVGDGPNRLCSGLVNQQKFPAGMS